MPRILIAGFGDIATRIARELGGGCELYGLIRNPTRASALRDLGVVPVSGDLDRSRSLYRIAGLADIVIHLAPPPATGVSDSRTKNLLAALGKSSILPQRLVYISTTGVYGDRGGEWVSETTPTRPGTARARRRCDAERQLRCFCRRNRISLCILRVPGIYGDGRLPLARLQAGTPVLDDPDDVYTNHIHAEDLARAVRAALWRGGGGRVYHVSDDSELRMGVYFDTVARHFGMPPPPRVPRSEAERILPPTLLSFMSESRRLLNDRMKSELRVALRYPTVEEGLAALAPRAP